MGARVSLHPETDSFGDIADQYHGARAQRDVLDARRAMVQSLQKCTTPAVVERLKERFERTFGTISSIDLSDPGQVRLLSGVCWLSDSICIPYIDGQQGRPVQQGVTPAGAVASVLSDVGALKGLDHHRGQL